MNNNIYLTEDLGKGECSSRGILIGGLFTPSIGDIIHYKGNKYKVNGRNLTYDHDGECLGMYLVVEKLYSEKEE